MKFQSNDNRGIVKRNSCTLRNDNSAIVFARGSQTSSFNSHGHPFFIALKFILPQFLHDFAPRLTVVCFGNLNSRWSFLLRTRVIRHRIIFPRFSLPSFSLRATLSLVIAVALNVSQNSSVSSFVFRGILCALALHILCAGVSFPSIFLPISTRQILHPRTHCSFFNVERQKWNFSQETSRSGERMNLRIFDPLTRFCSLFTHEQHVPGLSAGAEIFPRNTDHMTKYFT